MRVKTVMSLPKNIPERTDNNVKSKVNLRVLSAKLVNLYAKISKTCK